MKKLAILLGAALVAASPSLGAEITGRITQGDGNAVVEVSGQINDGDAEQLREILHNYREHGIHVSGVRLNSHGGNLRTAYFMADLIEKNGMDSVIGLNAYCDSACFLLFLAGHHKFVDSSAVIRVHSVAINGQEGESSEAATTRMARIFKRYGAPPSVVTKMVTTPATGLAPLTMEECRAMGATVFGHYANN